MAETMQTSIFCDIRCELGEGPAYEPDADTLWWFDIIGKRLMSRRMDGARTQMHEVPVLASAVAFDAQGRQYLVTERGIEQRDRVSGALTLLHPIEAETEATRSNDSRVHPSGALWVGTMGKDPSAVEGAIYHVRDGALTRLFSGIRIPNAICFSPAGDVAYFADTMINRLWRVACDTATGMPVAEPTVFLDQHSESGGLDGSVCDAEGVIWNARWSAARLDAYSPEGTRLRSIDLPALQTTCPAFVGAAADRLVVTSAMEGMSSEGRAKDAKGGMTFLLDVPVKGRHEPLFRP